MQLNVECLVTVYGYFTRIIVVMGSLNTDEVGTIWQRSIGDAAACRVSSICNSAQHLGENIACFFVGQRESCTIGYDVAICSDAEYSLGILPANGESSVDNCAGCRLVYALYAQFICTGRQIMESIAVFISRSNQYSILVDLEVFVRVER